MFEMCSFPTGKRVCFHFNYGYSFENVQLIIGFPQRNFSLNNKISEKVTMTYLKFFVQTPKARCVKATKSTYRIIVGFRRVFLPRRKKMLQRKEQIFILITRLNTESTRKYGKEGRNERSIKKTEFICYVNPNRTNNDYVDALST